MIDLEVAQRRVWGDVEALAVVESPLDAALGMVLAEPIVAGFDVPPFANSAMDGYAVNWDGDDAPAEFEVVGVAPAGPSALVGLRPGQAIRIMTGAPVPADARAVVPIESCDPSQHRVRLLVSPVSGRHIRNAGEDVLAGSAVIQAGSTVTPAVIGAAAMCGQTAVRCWRRPVVGVMSTGAELVSPPQPLQFGQIYDSNRPMLCALAAEAGAEVVDLGQVDDTAEAVERALESAARGCDLVLTSGGVSMGDHDFVKSVLLARGGEWMQVAIRPAKPLMVGVVADVPVIGLPGNPVSSAVSFQLFARPTIRSMMGDPHPAPFESRVELTEPVNAHPDLEQFLRVVWDGHRATPVVGQGSHQLGYLARASALARVPRGTGVVAEVGLIRLS